MEPKMSSRRGNWFSGSLKNASDLVNNQHQIKNKGGRGRIDCPSFLLPRTRGREIKSWETARETVVIRACGQKCPLFLASLFEQEPCFPLPNHSLAHIRFSLPPPGGSQSSWRCSEPQNGFFSKLQLTEHVWFPPCGTALRLPRLCCIFGLLCSTYLFLTYFVFLTFIVDCKVLFLDICVPHEPKLLIQQLLQVSLLMYKLTFSVLTFNARQRNTSSNNNTNVVHIGLDYNILYYNNISISTLRRKTTCFVLRNKKKIRW